MKSSEIGQTSGSIDDQIREIQLSLTGYGYTQADQDGFDGETVTATEHKEAEYFEALRVLLDVRPICENDSKAVT